MSRHNADAHDWREISAWFATWQAAQVAAADAIGPCLTALETSGTITRWWFIRKSVEWRIRYLPEPGAGGAVDASLDHAFAELARHTRGVSWAYTIYEPPTAAFGGPEALNTAHKLFHADSRHVLEHLAAGGGHQREIAILLSGALLRAAHRDWYDQGQIWHLLTRERTRPAHATTPAAKDALHHLLTADPAPPRLGVPPSWFAAFIRAGAAHFDLDRRGLTTRGLNAVLAHHVLYAWNRLGLSEPVQGAIIHTAANLVFDDTTPAGAPNTARHLPVTTNVGAVTTDTTDSAAKLRDALADRILGLGTFRTFAVEAAFRAVPRELFLPGVDLVEAYAPKVVVTKRSPDGTALSSASSPNIVAGQAEDLDVRPGQTILEIGAATGINAALLAEITGPEGRVVTIEIDQDLADRACAALDRAGYSAVTTICGDGAAGWAEAAPYDRIIVTAGAWDISQAWWDQLALGGRIVVPIRLHGSGLTRSLALDLQPTGELLGSYTRVCGFVPMRGDSAADATTTIPLTDQVTLNTATTDNPDTSALAQALTHAAHSHWTGINVTDHEPAEHLDLWLATTTEGFARLSVSADARKAGIADPALRWAGAGLYDAGTIAYITTRPHGPVSCEIGVVAHGPDSRGLTARLVELLQDWNHARPARPIITAYQAGTPDAQLGTGTRIERPDTRLTITW